MVMRHSKQKVQPCLYCFIIVLAQRCQLVWFTRKHGLTDIYDFCRFKLYIQTVVSDTSCAS